MNKNDLINIVSSKAGLTKADAAKAIDGVFESITESLGRGEEVRLVGFGTFLVYHRQATTGRNPRTKETIQIRAARLPKFRAGASLKEAVDK